MQQRIVKKIDVLKQLMKKDGFDGLVITDSIDQFYLLNFVFSPGEAVVLLSDKELVCFTRQLYVETLKQRIPFMRSEGVDKGMPVAAVAEAARLGLTKVGFDGEKEKYKVGCLFKQAGFVEYEGYISQLRQVKDEQEIASLRESNRIAFHTYQYIRPLVKTGMSEVELAAEIEKFMRMQGASSPSFNSIVAFGENTANPHHVASDRKLQDNEAVLIDYGCVYEGYCSDITRCWWHGDHEPEEYTKIWNIVDQARRAGIEAEVPGAITQQVDAAARDIIEAAGYGEYFTHRLGHGVGLEIHEEPNNDQTSQTVLQEGHVLTIEPGIYLPGKFGVRLEDTIVLTKTGSEILTCE